MTIKIASRSSKLALAQVDEFVKQFAISDYEIVKIKTEGDKKSAKGETLFDKAHFVSDIQKYILNGEAAIKKYGDQFINGIIEITTIKN